MHRLTFYLAVFSRLHLWSLRLWGCLQGGHILTGGSVIECEGNFVQPTIVEISQDAQIVKEELFGPVLYVLKFQVL